MIGTHVHTGWDGLWAPWNPWGEELNDVWNEKPNPELAGRSERLRAVRAGTGSLLSDESHRCVIQAPRASQRVEAACAEMSCLVPLLVSEHLSYLWLRVATINSLYLNAKHEDEKIIGTAWVKHSLLPPLLRALERGKEKKRKKEKRN